MGTTTTILGAASSLYGSSQAARAQKRSAEMMMEMARPYLEQAEYALPQLRKLAQNYYAPRVGKDSPWLRAEHLESMAGLQRANAQGLAEIQHTYASHGNMGRARGERLRLANQLVRTSSRENLSYGQAQESYRDNTANQYQAILAQLAGMGKTGLDAAETALGMQNTATSSYWQTFGQVFGDPKNWDILHQGLARLGKKKDPPPAAGSTAQPKTP